MNGQMKIQMNIKMNKQMDIQTNRQKNRQMNIQNNRQTKEDIGHVIGDPQNQQKLKQAHLVSFRLEQ